MFNPNSNGARARNNRGLEHRLLPEMPVEEFEIIAMMSATIDREFRQIKGMNNTQNVNVTREVMDLKYGEELEEQGCWDGDMSLNLSDLESVLVCCGCCEPLSTVPVLQCENGHLACSSCLVKFKERCSRCTESICYRSRAVEDVLCTLMVTCPNENYGCKVILPYGNKKKHLQKECIYSQFDSI